MPLKLIPPRKGKTPYWSIRGTYLGRYVDRSARTGKRAIAAKLLTKLEGEIERGELAEKGEATFASAAASFMNAGGERRFMTPLLKHFGNPPLREIDQAAIDDAAAKLYPTGSPATRNRQVYAPISCVLKHAGVTFQIRRPKGSAGNKGTAWLWPEQAFRLLEQASNLDAEFGLLCATLLYTGERLSEGLSLEVDRVRLSEGYAYLPDSKNGEPRAILLPTYLIAALANHPRGMNRPGEAVFRFTKSGHIYSLLRAAAAKADVELPPRVAFHIFCHSYATWMRRYGGLDTKGLASTGRWKDPKSVDRYTHVVVSEEAGKAELMPVPVRRA